jgi:hypothetical protein
MVKKQMGWVPPTRRPDPLEVLAASRRSREDVLKALSLLQPLARNGYGWLTVDDLVGSSDSDGIILQGGLLLAFHEQLYDRRMSAGHNGGQK